MASVNRSLEPQDDSENKADKDGNTGVILREVLTRTPSPTPEEAAELSKTSMFDWKAMKSWRYWLRKEWACAYFIHSPQIVFVSILDHDSLTSLYLLVRYLAGILGIVLIVLFVVYHEQIVEWLQPAAHWMHE